MQPYRSNAMGALFCCNVKRAVVAAVGLVYCRHVW